MKITKGKEVKAAGTAKEENMTQQDAGDHFKITHNIDSNDIAELLSAAFDGGKISYWASFMDTRLPEDFDINKVPWARERWAEVRKCYIAPLVEGGTVVITDEDGESHTLDMTAIHKGLTVMASTHKKHWADFLTGEFDACTADVFVQLCLFGEVVYA